jgi:hypothetical protein
VSIDLLNVTEPGEDGGPVMVQRTDGEDAIEYLCRVFEAIHGRPATAEELAEMANEIGA